MAHRLSTFVICAGICVLALSAGADAQQDPAAQFAALNWQEGPTEGNLGGIAKIKIPEGYRFVGKGGAGKFMELLQNPSDGSELGVLISTTDSWFVVFSFSDQGYVKDDDRDLDADAILSSIKEGTAQANKIRKERGWSTLDIVGWQQKPFYDPATNNLTWAIRGRSDDGSSINHSTRLLGRRGVMNVDLVLSPEQVGGALPTFNTLMTGFTFSPGHTYAEFTSGDKVAEYGLTGLIVGGVGVALVKSGLLQKFWKLIVLGLAAGGAAIKKFFFGGPTRQAGDQRANA